MRERGLLSGFSEVEKKEKEKEEGKSQVGGEKNGKNEKNGEEKEEQGEKKSVNKEEEWIIQSMNWEGAQGGVAAIKMGHFHGAKNFAGGLVALIKSNGEIPPKDPLNNVVNPSGGVVVGGDGGVTAAVDAVAGGDIATANAATTDSVGSAIEMDSAKIAPNSDASTANPTTTVTPAPEGANPSQQHSDLPPEIIKQHKETLRQLQGMRVYHLAGYHIPENGPLPPDLKLPVEDPTPQDPTCMFRLLENLTALRLRFEESLAAAAAGGDSKSSSGRGGVAAVGTTLGAGSSQWGGHAAEASGTEPSQDNQQPQLRFDKDKVAAAAGGGQYDEDADPLNAPEVIQAVLDFKRMLEERDVKSRKRRVDIITERMEKRVRELVEEGRKERKERKAKEEDERKRLELEKAKDGEKESGEGTASNGAAVAATAAEGGTVGDTGRRGVSNLPAWMTRGGADATPTSQPDSANNVNNIDGNDGDPESKKRKFIPSEANRDINVRKPRLDVEGGPSLSEIRAANEAADRAAASAPFVPQTTKEGILSPDSKFPTLSSSPSTSPESLKAFVTAQIVDYLGEEETTLIEFIMKELGKEGGYKVASMLDEMKVVLDEDAEEFVLGLYRKMVE